MSEVDGVASKKIAVVDWQELSCMLAYSAADSGVQVSIEIGIPVGVVLFGYEEEMVVLASTLLQPRVPVRSLRVERHRG
jgi:hypothetical protein